MRRRQVLAGLLGVAALPAARLGRAGDGTTLHLGLTAVILRDQGRFLERWRGYLERRLGRPVRFVQRRSYREITELVITGELDVAWVCGFPYVRNRGHMRLLAVPLWRGRPLYQSYLIVPASDRLTRSFADLEGAVFAYSDPDSNSGYLVPRYEMLRAHLQPSRLFRKTFFTWSHRDVVRAVAERVARGGAVDGYIWETLRKVEPRLTARTRVVLRSDWYGFPPLVAREDLAPETLAAVRGALVAMSAEPRGRELLEILALDGFTAGEDRLYDGIERVLRFVETVNAGRA